MTVMAALCADLRAEQESLAAELAGLEESSWDTPTPAVGWNIRDQIGHLAHGEELAALAATDPDGFRAELVRLMGDLDGGIGAVLARARAMDSITLLDWWADAREATLAALTGRDERERIAWAGPAMSARSFAAARLMETFAHGQDVRDALGLATVPTARLRHIAELGVRTRAFTYGLRELAAPDTDLHVALTAPNGEIWAWGPPDAPDRVSGPALDFCLVVTRRRHPADTRLRAEGPTAASWLEIAQCFLGAPDEGRPAGAFPLPA